MARQGTQPLQDGKPTAIRPMPCEPLILHINEVLFLIPGDIQISLNGSNHASMIIPAITNASISSSIEEVEVGVVKQHLRPGRQQRKPVVDFLSTVLQEMAWQTRCRHS